MLSAQLHIQRKYRKQIFTSRNLFVATHMNIKNVDEAKVNAHVTKARNMLIGRHA